MKKNVTVIFDGTGPLDNSVYQIAFKKSFCRQLFNSIPLSSYYRGVVGEETEEIATILPMVDDRIPFMQSSIEANSARARSFIGRQVPAGNEAMRGRSAEWAFEKASIFIIGYSRGGLTAVMLAQELAVRNIPVEAMFLFDAVNMTYRSSCDIPDKDKILKSELKRFESSNYKVCPADEKEYGTTIPGNVRYVYHAMRDPAFAEPYRLQAARLRNELKYLRDYRFNMANIGSQTAPKIERDVENRITMLEINLKKANTLADRTRSNRDSRFFNWGNCATEAVSHATKITKCFFPGSHGALGGCPWENDVFPTDERCAASVKAWMWPFIETHRLFQPGVTSLLFNGVRRLA